uniref:CSON000369 protein n=1 Tax=Culicoides sonorensis TaxID=179676 RepID=A0A336KW11_CULSO
MKLKVTNYKSASSSDDTGDEEPETMGTNQLLAPLDKESSSDEDETPEDKPETLKLDNQVKKKKTKTESNENKDEVSEKVPKKPKTDPECTIFIGNLPTNTKLKQLKQFYNKFGEIISLRFRSETGKKVLNKSDRKKYGSLNAYVVFKDREMAEKATSTNGEKFKENHIRCNLVVDKQDKFNQNLNSKSTVFVGNITFEANDEGLHEFFSTHCGEVEYVRRIPKKGFAYVCFKKGTPLIKALKLNGELFQGRPLRIQKWESKEAIEKREKRLKKKQAGKMKTNKSVRSKPSLDTTRPSNNPLLKKIREKTNQAEIVSKSDHKQKYRKGAQNKDKKEDKEKKKSEYFGLRTEKIKKAKANRKKELQGKKLKKIVKVLTGPVKKPAKA